MATETIDTGFKVPVYQTEAVLSKIANLGIPTNKQIANVARSGQLGTGIRLTKLDGATAATFSPLVGVVLTLPSMWDTNEQMQEMMRALMETHAKSITGVDFGYRLETADYIVGNDGQSLKVPTRTTRGEVSPSATFQELTGNIIWDLFRKWMFDINHPDTNASSITAYNDKGEEIPAWTISAYSMSMLFIQYDPTGLPGRIIDAFVVVGMYPTDIGDAGFERTLGTTKAMERSISFTGLVQHNQNTYELGVQVAKALGLHKINYDYALPGSAGSSDPTIAIQSSLTSFGGLNYEANGSSESGIKGAVDQYYPLNGEEISNPRSSGEIEKTGAATSSVAE